MHQVVVSNVTDTTDVRKGDKPAQAVLRIGDVNYWSICPRTQRWDSVSVCQLWLSSWSLRSSVLQAPVRQVPVLSV